MNKLIFIIILIVILVIMFFTKKGETYSGNTKVNTDVGTNQFGKNSNNIENTENTENTGIFNYFHWQFLNPYSLSMNKFFSNDTVGSV